MFGGRAEWSYTTAEFFRKASKSCSENFFLKSFERYFVLTFCRFEGLFWRENCFLMSIFLERESICCFFSVLTRKKVFVAFCLDLTAHCSFLPSRYIVPLSFLWMFFVKCLFLFCFSGISLFFIFTFLRFLFFVFFSVFFFENLDKFRPFLSTRNCEDQQGVMNRCLRRHWCFEPSFMIKISYELSLFFGWWEAALNWELRYFELKLVVYGR